MLSFFLLTLCQVVIPKVQLDDISQRIWVNECGAKDENLIHWKEGEEFLSLGIGHFIWYPEGYVGPFNERFPKFIAFCKEQKIPLPEWLQSARGCPWKSRESFNSSKNSEQYRTLFTFLKESRNLQALFMAERLQGALPAICKNLPSNQQKLITSRFCKVAETSIGWYVLIDYVNFKGEGISPSERYNGCGWGLLQVLEEMDENSDVLAAFRAGAKKVLTRRVENSPQERNEARWLKGWLARVDTYR